MPRTSNTKRATRKRCKTVKEVQGLDAVKQAEDFLFEGRPLAEREEWDARWTEAEKKAAHFVHYLKKKRTKWYEGIRLTIGSGEKASVVGELRPCSKP